MGPRLQLFLAQLNRFSTAFSLFVRDVARFNRGLLAKTVAYSVGGTTLQAFSLVAVLYGIRQMERTYGSGEQFLIEVQGVAFSPLVLLTLVVVFLLASVFLLYEAERATAELSVRYADRRTAELIGRFPVVAGRLGGATVHSRTGVPTSLGSELRRHSRNLELAARTLFRSPIAFFQLLYGMVFLLYLEPVLTVLLVVAILPLTVPLNRFTRQVKDSERQRRAAGASAGEDVAAVVRATEDVGARPEIPESFYRDAYWQSAFVRVNRFIYDRVVAQSRAKAIANIGLTVTVVIAGFYFLGLYGPAELSIANVLTFFVGLRLTAVGGRQVVSRVARFARFYETVRDSLSCRDRGDAVGPAGVQPIRVRATDLASGEVRQVRARAGTPLAVIGGFPLHPLGLAVLGEVLRSTARGTAPVGEVVFIPAIPSLDRTQRWRDILALPASMMPEEFADRAGPLCESLDVAAIAGCLDASLDACEVQCPRSQAAAVEVVLLAALFAGSGVVVLTEEACHAIRWEGLGRWTAALQDRALVVYYRYAGQPLGMMGEKDVVLIGPDGGLAAVTDVAWANHHREECREALGRVKGALAWEEPDEDDLDLDDD